MASMVENNLPAPTEVDGGGHAHDASLDDVHKNGVPGHPGGTAGQENGGDMDGTAPKSFYDEPEDGSGTRQTLIQNRYSFWYYRKGSQKDRDPSEAYESGIKEVESFQTVEHFWRIYNHLLRADKMPNATDVHLFRDGIKPTWEDPQNARGGQLLVRMKKGLAARAWEQLVLAIVGEQFDVGNEICGAVVSVRYSEDVISVWNRSASNTEGIEKIRESVKRLLKIPLFVQVEYRRHQDNLGALGGAKGEGGGYTNTTPGFGPRGGPPGAGGTWTRNRVGVRGGDDHHKDGDRMGPSAGNLPGETWARGPPDPRDRDRDGPSGFRHGGMGGFRGPGGSTWAERRAEGGGKDYGVGNKDFMRDRVDRSERDKELDKWSKIRKEPARDRESMYRDREIRDREPERDWGRLRRPGAGVSGGLGSGMRGGGDGDHRRPQPSGLAALERAGSAAWEDSKGRDWGKLRHGAQTPASPDREKRVDR